MNTSTFTLTDILGNVIEYVQIAWGGGEYTSMTLTDFKAQYPDEPVPTDQ